MRTTFTTRGTKRSVRRSVLLKFPRQTFANVLATSSLPHLHGGVPSAGDEHPPRPEPGDAHREHRVPVTVVPPRRGRDRLRDAAVAAGPEPRPRRRSLRARRRTLLRDGGPCTTRPRAGSSGHHRRTHASPPPARSAPFGSEKRHRAPSLRGAPVVSFKSSTRKSSMPSSSPPPPPPPSTPPPPPAFAFAHARGSPHVAAARVSLPPRRKLLGIVRAVVSDGGRSTRATLRHAPTPTSHSASSSPPAAAHTSAASFLWPAPTPSTPRAIASTREYAPCGCRHSATERPNRASTRHNAPAEVPWHVHRGDAPASATTQVTAPSRGGTSTANALPRVPRPRSRSPRKGARRSQPRRPPRSVATHATLAESLITAEHAPSFGDARATSLALAGRDPGGPEPEPEPEPAASSTRHACTLPSSAVEQIVWPSSDNAAAAVILHAASDADADADAPARCPPYVALDRKNASRSALATSHAFKHPSSLPVTKNAPSSDAATAFTAPRCSVRCATRTPRGVHASPVVPDAYSPATIDGLSSPFSSATKSAPEDVRACPFAADGASFAVAAPPPPYRCPTGGGGARAPGGTSGGDRGPKTAAHASSSMRSAPPPPAPADFASPPPPALALAASSKNDENCIPDPAAPNPPSPPGDAYENAPPSSLGVAAAASRPREEGS
eukprot:30929-Pelagococcus_subviridis.AAC.2